MKRKTVANLFGALLGISLLVAFGFALSGWFRTTRTAREGAPVSQQPQSISSQEQTSPPPTTPESSAPADPTADWRVYVNPQYGYSVGYPQGWYVTEEWGEAGGSRYNPVYFSEYPLLEKQPGATLLWITVHENPANLSPSDWLTQADKYLGVSAELIEDLPHEALMIDGREALRVEFLPSMMGRLDVFVPHGSRMYQLSLSPYDATDSQSVGKSIFSRMLETFKFVE